MTKPLTDAINALTTYANTVTGASDTTLSEAVATLANGYGQGGSSHNLPSAYQEVNFICVFTNCYFDFGVLSSSNPGFHFKGHLIARNGGGGPHIISTDNDYLVFAPRTGDSLVKLCGKESTSAGGLEVHTEVTANFNINCDGVFEMTRESGTTSATLTKGTLASGRVYFCAYGGGLTQTTYHCNTMLVYEVSIYDNGTMVQNYIPSYRKADGVIGLYDIINNNFITNIGSGTLAKGSDI